MHTSPCHAARPPAGPAQVDAVDTLDRRGAGQAQKEVANILVGVSFEHGELPPGTRAWTLFESASEPAGKDHSPRALAEAVNARYDRTKAMSWSAAMADDLASIGVAGVWWSAHQRPVPVTLTTQASLDRLTQLYTQCKSWKGPLSAVVFIGLEQDSRDTGLSDPNVLLIKKAIAHVRDTCMHADSVMSKVRGRQRL